MIIRDNLKKEGFLAVFMLIFLVVSFSEGLCQ